MSSFNLQQHEIAVEKIHRNLPPSALYEHAILYENDAHIAENGALVAYSGVKTGAASPGRDTGSPQYLVGQGRLRGDGEEASQSFCQELCDL